MLWWQAPLDKAFAWLAGDRKIRTLSDFDLADFPMEHRKSAFFKIFITE